MAEHLGVSRSMVQRVWKAKGLKPHRIRNSTVSNDKHIIEKMTGMVGPVFEFSRVCPGVVRRREGFDRGAGSH
ncbi:MAG: hypothetical protein KJ052_16280, partial [Candidatus Hydrogenedentes bacterium]|nr:hypothetical protein [Candidatus Hydrogenedentota bacterium]